jgi:ArsR family metal-binding transcriptional regulator
MTIEEMRTIDGLKTYKELQEAKERIARLEDRINRAATAFFEDGSDASVASGMLTILEEERNRKVK